MDNEKYDNFLRKIRSGMILGYVPYEYRTYELCLEATKVNGFNLFNVPLKHKSYELCLEAVKQYGFSLLYVPENLKDYGMCLAAVRGNAFSLNNVPKKHITYNKHKLKKTVNKSQYRLISIETSNSYVINFQSNTDINVNAYNNSKVSPNFK